MLVLDLYRPCSVKRASLRGTQATKSPKTVIEVTYWEELATGNASVPLDPQNFFQMIFRNSKFVSFQCGLNLVPVALDSELSNYRNFSVFSMILFSRLAFHVTRIKFYNMVFWTLNLRWMKIDDLISSINQSMVDLLISLKL